MKRFLALMVAMGVIAIASPQEAQAQHWHRGGSGFAISIGNGFGGFGGFNPYGFGGHGFRPAGFNVGYSAFRPAYGFNHVRPSYGYRNFNSYRGGYRGGCGW